jgi:hypothetical protein
MAGMGVGQGTPEWLAGRGPCRSARPASRWRS